MRRIKVKVKVKVETIGAVSLTLATHGNDSVATWIAQRVEFLVDLHIEPSGACSGVDMRLEIRDCKSART